MKTAGKKWPGYSIVSSFFVLSMSHAGHGMAAEPLSADQLRSLLVGKTVSLTNLEKGFEIELYFSPDGTLVGENLTAKKKIKGNWEITSDGLHCTASNLSARTCGSFVANGDGTYQRIVDGTPVQTYKAFMDGNPKGY